VSIAADATVGDARVMRTFIVLPVVAAALTLLAGLGALAVGLLLAALGMSGMGRIDLPGVGPVIGLTVVMAAAYGLAAVGAAVGLLRDAPWSLVVAGALHGIGALGAVIALATAGPSAPALVGLGLALAGLASVAALAVVTGPRPAPHFG